MAIGTALALAGLASAGGQIFGAAKQSSAAKAAAKEQEAAAQRASDYYRQGLGQLGQMYAPYINSGMSVMGTLGRLTTPGPGARYASMGPPNQMPVMPQGGGYAVPRGGAPPPGPFGAMVQMPGGPQRMPPQFANQMMANGMGRPVQGPYAMAGGGDVIVDQPTIFIAGEAGPERATFSGSPFAALAAQPLDLTGRGMRAGPSGRAGALQGAVRGQMQGAGANALRSPFAGMYAGV
jgi:hypothetical protein